ncbi:MAG: hypothetical protein FWE64_01705 [Alphaproteobacteria bacterium]|nr:hypothetical protein [Alphaproteobacteria bacterium]
MKFLFIILSLVLSGMLSAHAQAKSLRLGNGMVVHLTADKKSSPALHVLVDGTIWYGFLTAGTATGRLTLRMPSGDIYSLIAGTSHTFSTIWDDHPQVWTWYQPFQNANPRYNGAVVIFNASWDGLTRIGVWPDYHLQTMCSNNTGTYAQPGNPVYAVNGLRCWCRLKRRSDGANGGWLFVWTTTTAAYCAVNCTQDCAGHTVEVPIFRSALFNAFANP